jgi:hypothetical protein
MPAEVEPKLNMQEFQKKIIGRFRSLAWWPRITLMRMRGEKRVALASYPRSGNTWLRLLIEEATGQMSGTIYGGNEVIKRSSEGIVIKTHGWDAYKYTHAIHLLRNPFDVCVSYYEYSKDIYGEKELDWQTFLQRTVSEWRGHTLRWMRAANTMPIHRIKYEDLLLTPETELKALLDWLGFDIPDSNIKQAVEATSLKKLQKKHPRRGKRFFRKGKSGLGISTFSSEDRSFLLEQAGALMAELDYAPES